MPNKKGIQMAISTIILIVLGILVLIALVVALIGGFDKFKSTTDPYLDTIEAIAVKQACDLACENSISKTFCCTEQDLNGEKVTCSDQRLGVECPAINCEGVCNLLPPPPPPPAP